MVQLQLSHVSESWSVLLLVILIIISDTAVDINQMNSMYDCRYCNSFSFKDNRALVSHLRVRHFVAEEVNMKAGCVCGPRKR